MLAAAFCLFATGQDVPLAGVPASDREVRFRSFRSGVPLRLAGNEYPDSVGIASYGSLVYNLDGFAESFRAIAGPGDDAAGTDGIRLDVIVDRKLRESIPFGAGDKPARLFIDLTGARQLELSVQFGPRCKTQPLVFADASFQVKEKAAFLEALARWQHRIEMERETAPPSPPPLPDWKLIRVERFRWHGFANACRIGNGVLEVEVVPEFGGRIVGFRRAGGENILKQPAHPLPADLRRGRSYYRQHTRFSRSEPAWYFLPGEDLHLFGPYRLRFGGEGEIVMTSRPSWYLFLEVEYRIRLRPGADRLEVTTVYRNLGDFNRPCGIWTAAVLPTEKVAEIEVAASGNDWFDPAESVSCWEQAGETARLKFPVSGFRSVERKSRSNSGRLRARLNSGEHFTLSSTGNRGEYPTHIYGTAEFVELELHSAVVDLPPGGTVSLQELWQLEDSIRMTENAN